MQLGKRSRRVVAATLLTVLLTNTLAPTVSYALTSGPTAPEATSFEPVDTTDMVNLQTGDFTYNIPLLEVPGPEGGYPLSLSYHAGIQPNEDASWVGLGWNLSPGAINRSVNGYADDAKQVIYTQRAYWEGGSTSGYTVGVSIGLAGTPASVNFGLSFSQDTYQGFGVGGYLGLGYNFGGSDFGLQVGIDVDPYGEVSSSLGGKYLSNSFSAGIGVNTNFQSVSVSGNMSFRSLGISMSSSGSFSASIYGVSATIYNSNAGKIRTSSMGFEIPIPIIPGVLSLSLGHNYQRYWSDEKTSIATYGTLYMSGQDPSNFDNAYDSYSLLEYPDKNIIDNPDPNTLQGGAFPDFDNYMVLGQGLSGNIRPYIYQGKVAGQSKKDNSNNILLKYYVGGSTNINHTNPQFRFVNDFSNKYVQSNYNYTFNSGYKNTAAPFDGTPQYGIDGFNATKQKLSGSRNIEFFTNQQIKSESTAKNNGFIEPSNCLGFERKTSTLSSFNILIPDMTSYTPPSSECTVQSINYTPGVGRLFKVTCPEYTIKDQIGGFSITNEEGVTYHYGLPVYAFEEIVFSEKIDGSAQNGGYGSNALAKPKLYAYSWLLTSITGPDFVDRNADGKAGSDDWGYWVNFSYGKWTDQFIWRNPSEGYHRDVDNNFRNFSMGKKELYYLNAIQTRTHTAIFEKNVRKDAVGEADNIFDFDGGNRRYTSAGAFDLNKTVLGLEKVYLFNNSDASFVTALSGSMPNVYSGNYPGNVIDEFDVNTVGRAMLESKAVRIIDFNYNYSLCPGTANSSPDVEKGKLTLYSINARGKGGIYTVPPTVFDYELSTLEQKSGSIVTNAAGIISSSVALTEGDLLVLNNATNQFLGVVTISPTGDMVLKGGNAVPNTTYNFRTTKNPPYNKDYYDAWGLYKPDLVQPLLAANENLARKTSKASANSTDVWSLRKIKTSLGAEIKVTYESDAFGKIGIQNGNTAIITSFSYDDVNDLLTLSIQDDYNLLPLSQMFVVGEKLDFIAEQYVAARLPDCQFTTIKYIRDTRPFGGLEIHSVNQGNKTITVKLPGLFLTGDPWFGNSSCGPGNYGPYIAGNLFLKDINDIGYGSGLRVKSLAINSPSFSNYTYYKYEAVGNPGVSSGITSFEPNILDISAFNDNSDDTKAYKKVLYANINYLLTISRIVPPPGVMYEYVTIENKVKNSDESNERSVEGKTEYQFEVFDPKMIDRKKISSSANGAEYAVNLSFRNSTASIGNLKRATKYDNLGKKLSESVLHHLHDDIAGSTNDDFYATYNTRLDQFNKQGLIMQRYSEVKEVKQNNTSAFDVKATLSSWEEFPNVTTGQTNTNYVTGVSATNSNLGFDFYSGSVIKKLNIDPYGNRFITEIIPAYQKYPKMGLKVNDITNKNMLSQETSVRIYKVDANNNNLGLVTASVDTWSNSVGVIDKEGNSWVQNNASTVGNVWRKQSTYGWSPEGKTLNGLTALGSFSDFNWSTPSSVSTDWKKMSEITLYEVNSKALEVKDMNDKYGATKLGYNNSLVLMSASNSRYDEIAFSGAEDDLINGKFGGNVAPGDGVVLNVSSVAPSLVHTGRKSLKVSGSQSGFSYTPILDDTKQYLASVWVKSENGNIPSGAQIYVSRFGLSPISASVTDKVANGWYLIQIIVPGYSDNVTTISCKNTGGSNLIFDDFRFQPINALSSAYVYDPFSGELTYILDGNNLYTRYEYDAAGRLIRTYREKLGIGEFKTNEYQYNLGGAF